MLDAICVGMFVEWGRISMMGRDDSGRVVGRLPNTKPALKAMELTGEK